MSEYFTKLRYEPSWYRSATPALADIPVVVLAPPAASVAVFFGEPSRNRDPRVAMSRDAFNIQTSHVSNAYETHTKRIRSMSMFLCSAKGSKGSKGPCLKVSSFRHQSRRWSPAPWDIGVTSIAQPWWRDVTSPTPLHCERAQWCSSAIPVRIEADWPWDYLKLIPIKIHEHLSATSHRIKTMLKLPRTWSEFANTKTNQN